MKRAAIVIGHGPRYDKGAVSQDGKTNELEWNRDLAQRIHFILNDSSINSSIVHRTTERLQPVRETNATNADMAIELHLNSFNGSASGTEMIAVSSKGRQLGSLLLHAATRVLRLPDRGVKPPQGGGRGARWLKGTTMPAVIVESFFIDNPADLQRGNEQKQALAEAYAAALVKFAQTL